MQIINWHNFFIKEKYQPYYINIFNNILHQKSLGKIIYPPKEKIFHALKLTSLKNIKAVILGQDPYHGYNQANGLSFSVTRGIKIPPSLFNIYKEISNDIKNFSWPKHGDLNNWAKQGVLLLNTILTVEEGKPYSHKHLGWEKFTDKIIKLINDHCNQIVFLLWGKKAQEKKRMINKNKHKVFLAAHPSPFSAHLGFFGCKHFSKTNDFLEKCNKKPINWNII